MIPRNLQNVSKTASHSNKYCLLRTHKRNLILNNTLYSINKNTCQSSNSSVTYKQKYCFSKIKQSEDKSILISNTKDIIPSNLNLSDKEYSNIQNIVDYLLKTGQTKIVYFLSEQLRKSTHQSLSKQSIHFLTENEQIIKNLKYKNQSDQTYLKLSFIQSTPKDSIEIAKNEMKLSENDIVNGIHRSSIIINKKGEHHVYHGWISETISKTPILPKHAQSFVTTLKKKSSNIKQETITIAVIDKKLKKHLKTFKDVIIYALSLQGINGGFHKIPKCALLSNNTIKVIAKSTIANENENDEDDEENDEEEENDDDTTILNEVEKIQTKLGKRAKKQEYRAEHLKKWQYKLENIEKKVDNEKKDIIEIENNMKNREENINNESQELSKISNNLKWKDLKNKRGVSEIQYKKQAYIDMKHKLNKQDKQLIEKENKLKEKENNINDIEIRLNIESKQLIQNENNIKLKEEKLNTEIIKFENNNNEYLKDKQLLEKKRIEIEKEKKFVCNEKLRIENERNILNKDQNEWRVKVKVFEEKYAEINKLEINLENNTNKMNKQKEEIEKAKEIIHINISENENKSIYLEEKGEKLKEKEMKLSERECDLKLKENLLNEKQNEFDKLENELKNNQNIYNITINKLENDKLRFEKDKNKFDIDNKLLKEKQLLYEKDAKELNKEQISLDIKLENMRQEKLKIDVQKKEIIQEENKLDLNKIELNKDKIWIEKEINSLNKQENEFAEIKMEIEEKEKDINKRFVELNTERNRYENDKIKTQELEKELNKKQNELDNKIKITEENEINICNKYNELKKEENEIMNKIEPIKQEEIMLNKRQELLCKKEIENKKEFENIEIENIKIIKKQKSLEMERIELKKEDIRLVSLDKQLENKYIKICEQNKRVTNMYDEFNKEKYKILKLKQSLNRKENEIIEQEEKINIKQENVYKKEITINKEREIIIEKRKEFERLENDFNILQKNYNKKEKEFEEKYNIFLYNKMELDSMNSLYIKNRHILDEERIVINSENNMIKQEKDYIKQQNQSLNVLKKELDMEKLKIEQNGLLLATGRQQLEEESEILKCDYSKLEKINRDLKNAQIKHGQEDEKLRIWKIELENEEKRLNNLQETLIIRTKTLDITASKLNEEEIELNKIAKSVENRNIEIKLFDKKERIICEKENILKQEYDSQKEKEELIKISKQQILYQQEEIVNKEKQLTQDTIKLHQTLKDVNDKKYELNIEITKKETQLLNKQDILRDKDLNISKMERVIKQKEIELKNKENELAEKEYELLNLQRDLDLNKTQIRMEIKRNKNEINNEKLEIEIEKNNLLIIKQNELNELNQHDDEKKELNINVCVLKNKCDELQNEIYEMESNILILNNKLNYLTNQNNELIEEKLILKNNIIENDKLTKQLKRPIDEQKRLLKEEKVENYKQEEYIKHLMSSLKKKQRFIESKENKIQKQEHELRNKIEIHKEKENKIQTEQMTLDRIKQDVDNEKKMYQEKLKLVTGLQQNLKRTQDSSQHKDIIINQLQNKYSQVNSNYMKQKNIQINLQRMHNKLNHQHALINKLQNENRELKLKKKKKKKKKIETKENQSKYIPITQTMSIEPITIMSKHNNIFKLPLIIQPKSIPITATKIYSSKTETIISKSINIVEPTNIISKHNQAIPIAIPIPIPIAINIPIIPLCKTPIIKCVPLNTVDETSQISKHNVWKLPSYIEPKSIDINIAKMPTFNDLTSLQQRIISVEDEIFDLLPFNSAEPISMISSTNICHINIAKSIDINHPYIKPKHDDKFTSIVALCTVTSLSPLSRFNISESVNNITPKSIPITEVKISIVQSVPPLTTATQTSQMSRHNIQKLPSYIEPKSIPKSIPIAIAIPINIPLCVAEPISILSRYNSGKLLMDDITCMIPVTSIIEATDNLLSHHVEKHINIEKFKEDLQTLKELDENREIEPKIEIVNEDIEFESLLNENDFDVLFQCTTNKDLLFDDIDHIDSILCGLNDELQNCLMECRDYKSMIKELPSQFKSKIGNIFTGDVICCLEWKFDNNEYNNLYNNVIPKLIEKCHNAIDSNRELIKQYNIAIKDDRKRSVSNRNKLRGGNREKMNVFDINKYINCEFKNDLDYELLALQYSNSEWLLLQSMLNEWNNYIEKLTNIDIDAVNTSNALYLRSFCILPSQTIDDRKKIACETNCDYLSNQLKYRKWVNELNNLFNELKDNNDIDCNFDIYYSEMGNINNWKDKCLIRDLMSYLLNGTNFELNSEYSKYIPLSEGFIRIGYQSQLLIESAQSLLGYIDPYIEQIITCTQNWVNRDDNINININNRENIELSLQNGKELIQINPYDLKTKTSLERAKMLEIDAKYAALFKDALSTDLDALLSQNEVDTVYMKKLHKFLRSYFEKLYRDELMLPTPNSTIIEETAPQTWQKHALLEVVCNDEFYKILKLLSNEKITKHICDFVSYNVYDMNKEHLNSNEQENKSLKMFNELFKPFDIFKEYYEINIKQKMYEIISDFDIQQYLSDNIYQIALNHKSQLSELSDNKNKKEEKNELWYDMKYANKVLKPLQFKRDHDMKDVEMPQFTDEERLATYWTGYLKGVLNNVPVERPIRLPEQYHDITTGCDDDPGYLKHLQQHYYIDSYKPPSHEDTAERISIEDKMNGVDIYRDQYIQRPHQSKRILETKLQFLFHNKLDYMKGAFPLENFNYLPWGTKKPTKHRVTVRKSTFVQARAQENYETRIYSKIATNYKLTSNRTADMFNARGFDLIYDSIRII